MESVHELPLYLLGRAGFALVLGIGHQHKVPLLRRELVGARFIFTLRTENKNKYMF